MLDTLASDFDFGTVADIAAAVSSGRSTARRVIEAALARIRARDPALNSFTAITEQRALLRAQAVDARCARGEYAGPLAGVPFAVKNLFDVAGLPTLAGSKINRDRPPAMRDAALVERLEAAGILVGALNMGEYAYDFTGENIHDGPSRNPHDRDRMTGGSSGGSGAAVGGGLVPLALGSDTNGSIRVPSSLCGIFGLKPTYGRLTARAPFRLSLASIMWDRWPVPRAIWRLPTTPCRVSMPAIRPAPIDRSSQSLHNWSKGLTVCALRSLAAISSAIMETLATQSIAWRRRLALTATSKFRKPSARVRRPLSSPRARVASLHLNRLRTQAREFDPAVRDRLLAGAMTPTSLVVKAQKFRRWYQTEILKLFTEVDAILAPATPCTAPLLGQHTFMFGDTELLVRANLGLYTQPISFIGLPVVAVPMPLAPLPIGVQIIAAPWREDVCLRLAQALETKGVVTAMRPAS